jgi:3-carboxymuconate cyclase
MKSIPALLLCLLLAQPFYAQNGHYRLLVGTYTKPDKSQGIYSYDVDLNTGTFTQKSVAKASNPSFLVLTPDKKFVYSVNEGSESSAANAFSFDEATANLTFINRSLTNGSGPCYIAATKNHVFTANYNGGSISVFRRNADGSLSDLVQKIQHVGGSIDKNRQNEPHVHQVFVSPDQKYVLANDLGTDKVTVYKYDSGAPSEVLVPWDTLTVKLGSGPRHLTFSKDGKRIYLIQEMDGTLSVIGMKDGKIKLIQETSVIRDNGKGWAADIHLSPDGKFLYATNRAPANNITCFAVAKDGRLQYKQQVSTKGDGPRNFSLTPDGRYLFVAHQSTDNIVLFKRDVKTGSLTDTGKRIDVGSPVCLVFY